MTPLQIEYHSQHKARLQRFADAAARHSGQVIKQTDAEQSRLLEKYLMPRQELELPTPQPRRQYESRSAFDAPFMPMFQRILRVIADEFHVSIPDMLSPCRDKEFSIPRFVVIGLISDLTRMSLPAIGRRLGGRDHSTIVNGRDRIKTLLESEAFRNRYDQIKAELRA